MKALLSVALCGLIMAVTSNVSASTMFLHVPLVLWSPRPIFAGANAYLSYGMDETAVASTLKLVMTRDMSGDRKGVLSTEKTLVEQAEILCLFLLPSLTLEDMAQLSIGTDSFVQNAVQHSVSSVVIPQTTRMKPLLTELTNVKSHIVEFEDLDMFVASAEGQMLFSNDKTDLLVVQLPETMPLSNVDAVVQTASSNLDAVSGGKTDFAFTGNDATLVELKDPLTRRLTAQAKAKTNSIQATTVCETGYLVGLNAAGKAFCFSHYVNITPDIMAGLLFGLLFIFLAYIGLSVLHQIQTPQRYPSHGAPRGKEF